MYDQYLEVINIAHDLSSALNAVIISIPNKYDVTELGGYVKYHKTEVGYHCQSFYDIRAGFRRVSSSCFSYKLKSVETFNIMIPYDFFSSLSGMKEREAEKCIHNFMYILAMDHARISSSVRHLVGKLRSTIKKAEHALIVTELESKDRKNISEHLNALDEMLYADCLESLYEDTYMMALRMIGFGNNEKNRAI